jgi:hypothetical protein
MKNVLLSGDSSYTICNKGVSTIARKKGELKDKDKPPTEWWGVSV